MSKEIIIT